MLHISDYLAPVLFKIILLLFLEGILLFNDLKLRELMDMRVFVDTPWIFVLLLGERERDIIEKKSLSRIGDKTVY